MSVNTTNLYLVKLKSFVKWMKKCKPPRISENPFENLEFGNGEVDRRHDRRELTAEELRLLLETARTSQRVFRGLDGEARYHLYATACGTGFRASGLASLTPESFKLKTKKPTVTLAARNNKSRKTKLQPLPADIADLLREYLKGKPAGQPIWGGTWAKNRKGSEMLRIDLEVAGIPYVIDGPEGPLFADFHALRHTYLTLGGRAGIDLRTLQELAGHSTSKLTERYSHVRLDHMADAIEKLPSFLPGDRAQAEPQQLQATGTDGPPVRAYRLLTETPDGEGCRLMLVEGGDTETAAAGTERNPLQLQGVAGDRRPVMADDGRDREEPVSSEHHMP